ncbi:MAG: hypothetical protein ACREKM_08300, partial [Longimicrobiales bacterium]
LIAAAVIGVVFTSCKSWIEKLPSPIVCAPTTTRPTVIDTIGPEGGTIAAGYADATFASGTFVSPTVIRLGPHPVLHGFYLDIPSESTSPAFTATFDVDYCGDQDQDGSYRIVTRHGDGGGPAAAVRGFVSRPIARGEIEDDVPKRAGIAFPEPPIAGGFVILSN